MNGQAGGSEAGSAGSTLAGEAAGWVGWRNATGGNMNVRRIAPFWCDLVVKAVAGTLAIAVLSGVTGLGSAAYAAPTEQAGVCDKPESLGGDAKLRVTELMGRALIELVKPHAGGRTLQIEYGDELYVQKFGANGAIRLGFALTAANNEFTLTMSEMPPVKCTLQVPEFGRIYRAILRWHDPVQLDLNVLEPGGRMGESGNVSGGNPNTDLELGIGRMDVIGGVPAEDATGEMSYVADASAAPPDGVFGFKVDFVTRGSEAKPPYCGDGALAAPRIDFITIANGKVTVTKQTLARARCGDKIPDRLRLMMIRQ